ncbi:MAG: LytTR family DNA-binding domain-containing protein [Eubacteriales bacterium]|nr:LytTR family DNA-binding domain-containing protein [Clostridiales bacterium]MDY2769644.1 LytTR family DNA-binding domain-containing protein [Eubacteriales bacterium]
MDDIRILIADDDDGMRLIMRRFVEKAGGFQIVGEAKDGRELIRLNEQTHPQVILLDVEMPVMTGVECARIIQDINPKTILVFATAHEKYMGDAFEVYAFDYLLKPFREQRVMKTLALIRSRLAEEAEERAVKPETPRNVAPRKLMLRHKEGVSFVDMEDILLIQREERSTVLYLAGGERLVTSDSLSELDERLPDDMFFRTHKSYVVGLRHIDSITPYGRWTYVVKLRGTTHDALVTAERLEILQKMFA